MIGRPISLHDAFNAFECLGEVAVRVSHHTVKRDDGTLTISPNNINKLVFALEREKADVKPGNAKKKAGGKKKKGKGKNKQEKKTKAACAPCCSVSDCALVSWPCKMNTEWHYRPIMHRVRARYMHTGGGRRQRR